MLQDTDAGWLRRLEATPMPAWAYFAGEARKRSCSRRWWSGRSSPWPCSAACCSTPSAWPGPRLLLGALASSAMGLALAFWVRPRAATALGNLLFLPLAWAPAAAGYRRDARR